MADNTKVEWCHATINPLYGCTKVSPGCTHCCALRSAPRLSSLGLTSGTYENREWTGQINLFPERMEQALRWKRPRRIFVGIMSDLFHPNVPDEFRDKVFAYMALANQHTFIILTKRAAEMHAYLTSKRLATSKIATAAFESIEVTKFHKIAAMKAFRAMGTGTPLSNVWGGVTVESQEQFDLRAAYLLDSPLALRFLSVEPMLGYIDITRLDLSDTKTYHPLTGEMHSINSGCGPWHATGSYSTSSDAAKIDWVICGGESGPKARPVHPEWVKCLKDQCEEEGIPFFFKQWGEWLPCAAPRFPYKSLKYGLLNSNGELVTDIPYEETLPALGEKWLVYRIGKKKAGAQLVGYEYKQFPNVPIGVDYERLD